MGDLFHECVLGSDIRHISNVMEHTQRHTFQVLTKRPERARDLHGVWGRLFPDNVWLGTTVENVDCADRINALRTIPATVRFLSCEPLLGPLPGLRLDGIHWVIVGGESGPGARPMNPAWVLGIKDQCAAAGVPFFFKQWGGVNKKRSGRVLCGREWNEMPL